MWLLSLSDVWRTSSDDSKEGCDSVDHWGVSSFLRSPSVFTFRSPMIGNKLTFCSWRKLLSLACCCCCCESNTDQSQEPSLAKLSPRTHSSYWRKAKIQNDNRTYCLVSGGLLRYHRLRIWIIVIAPSPITPVVRALLLLLLLGSLLVSIQVVLVVLLRILHIPVTLKFIGDLEFKY